MQTVEARPDGAQAMPCVPGPALRPAAASTLSPAWLQALPEVAQVVAVFEQAVYLRRGQDVLPLLAPEALLLPGALRVPSRADLDALRVRVGDTALVGQGQVLTAGGGLVVRRRWRPQAVPSSPLPEGARAVALAALAGLDPVDDPLAGRLTELAAAALARSAAERTAAVRGLVGLGPGLTPAGDDVLCGLLLGLRVTGQPGQRSVLEDAVTPLLGRTTALSATLLRQAAQGYAVPPVVNLLSAWHRGVSVAALASIGQQVAAIGHTSGPALALGLTTVLRLAAAAAAPHTSTLQTCTAAQPTVPTVPTRPQPLLAVATSGTTRGTS